MEEVNQCQTKKTYKPVNQKQSNEEVIAEVERLRMENEYLKKLNALIQEKETVLIIQ